MISQPSSAVRPEPVPHAGHPRYAERVYAGLLGKLIGVYLGRPIENWSHEKIVEQFGEVDYYIHELRNRLLIVTDDDVSGTLTFLRTLQDTGYDPDFTPDQVGQCWLNYLIENKTILWWGGMGNSTEHTAYLRLKSGITAPRSGSAALNSKIVSEQIGSQIFIDGWGMVCPGDPERAADFARRAASVSHDGEAIYGAQVVAAMVALAFVEEDIEKVVEGAVAQVPSGCVVRQMIDHLREWKALGDDWRTARGRVVTHYGYDKYLGNCHLVPNLGVVMLSLIQGEGDFDQSLMIANTCGWDTDCNSGNVGAVLGVLNGLPGMNGKDWRGPVADRLYLPSADPGRAITDAMAEALEVANAGRALSGLAPLRPKAGARFHFSLPGSVQGWQATAGLVANTSDEPSVAEGLLIRAVEGPVKVASATFIPPEFKDVVTGYVLVASPTLYPGQCVTTQVAAEGQGAKGRLYLSRYNEEDLTTTCEGPEFELLPGESQTIRWTVPDQGGFPIHEIGIALDRGGLVLEKMDWYGVPKTSWPPCPGTMWARAWALALDRFQYPRDKYEFMTHNEGVGLLIQGQRAWDDYRVRVRLTPRMAVSSGIGVRCQGMTRYYAFVFGESGEVRLDKVYGGRQPLARVKFPWKPFRDYEFCAEVCGTRLRLYIDGELILQATDGEDPIPSGAFAFVVEAGCLGAGTPSIEPVGAQAY